MHSNATTTVTRSAADRLSVAARLLPTHPRLAYDILQGVQTDVGQLIDVDESVARRKSVEWEDADRTRARIIIRECAEEAGIHASVILGNRRPTHIVAARRKAASRLRDEMSLSYPAIGQALGGRHHTTIMNLLGLLDKNRGKAGREAGA